MSDIYLNGKGYGPKDGPATFSDFANRAFADDKGNNIKDTYKSDPHKNLESQKDFMENLSQNAGTHNSIFMGRNITERFDSGDVYEKIKDGSFEDLFIGDYFIKSINGTNKTCRIAGFDIYDTSYYNKFIHHAVIVPDEHFGEVKMNSTNTTAGGYKGSALRASFIPSVNDWLTSAFGTYHVLKIKEYLTDTVDASIASPGYRGWNTVSSSWAETESIAELMTEIEVYGSRVWSSSGYDVGLGTAQFPLFSLAPQYINPGRYSWWLRGVAQSTAFCRVLGYGSAGCSVASGTGYYVRPRWCIW